jgi:signal transduction histidine kinase
MRGHGRPRVLIVDDEDVVLSVCARVLIQAGYDPVPTTSGREAIQVVDRQSLDAALVDVRLPDLDGPDVIAALRDRDPDLPCVVMSGYASFDDAVRCLQRGAADFLKKPFEVDALVEVIDRAITTTHLRSDSALLAATRSIFASLDSAQIARHVLEIARSMLKADEVLLVRAIGIDPGETLRLGGGSDAVLVHEAPMRGAIWDRLVDLREATVFTPAASGSDSEVVATLAPTAKSLLTHRLAVGDRLVGLVAAARSQHGRDFGERDLRRAAMLAGHASLSLDNSRLHNAVAEKKRELEETFDRLIVAERAATLARLSAALGHEIANPATAILYSLEAAEAAIARGELPELTAAIARARAGTNAVLDICKALRPLGSHAGARADLVDLRQVIEGSALIVGGELRHRARVTMAIAPELPLIRGDAGRLGQVFLNLFTNAAQALPAGGADRHEVRVSAELVDAHVVAAVEDTGPGVPDALVPRLFETGATSRAAHEGHGTGLAVCRWIVEEAGGSIRYQRRECGGARFEIRLPATGR